MNAIRVLNGVVFFAVLWSIPFTSAALELQSKIRYPEAKSVTVDVKCLRYSHTYKDLAPFFVSGVYLPPRTLEAFDIVSIGRCKITFSVICQNGNTCGSCVANLSNPDYRNVVLESTTGPLNSLELTCQDYKHWLP